jgi:hypothetical protein
MQKILSLLILTSIFTNTFTTEESNPKDSTTENIQLNKQRKKSLLALCISTLGHAIGTKYIYTEVRSSNNERFQACAFIYDLYNVYREYTDIKALLDDKEVKPRFDAMLLIAYHIPVAISEKL